MSIMNHVTYVNNVKTSTNCFRNPTLDKQNDYYVTLSLFGFGFFDWPRWWDLLDTSNTNGRSHIDSFHSSRHSSRHSSCRGAFERVVRAELSPFCSKHCHHFWHGDLGVLLGNEGPNHKEKWQRKTYSICHALWWFYSR